jgi:hypothetical protein
MEGLEAIDDVEVLLPPLTGIYAAESLADRSTRPIVGDFCDSIARWRLSPFTGQIQLEIRMAISRLVCRLCYRAESQDRCLIEPF